MDNETGRIFTAGYYNRAGWGYGPAGQLTVSPTRLEFVQSSARVHYVFAKEEVDHLRFDFLRIGGIPVHPLKMIHIVLSTGKTTPIAVRPCSKRECFSELQRSGWDLRL